MRKTMKIMAVVIAIAMVASMSAAMSVVSANDIPNTWTKDKLTIGFFNFVEGRGTHLEVRTSKIPAAFGVTQPYTIDGISRLREISLNDDALGGPAAGASVPGTIVFAGAVTTDYGFSKDVAAADAAVDGMGTISFTAGEFAIVWGDGSSTIYDLAGVVLSNQEAATPTPTPTTTAATTTTGSGTTTTNPPTGVAIALIPTLLAAGAAIMVSRKRK